MGIGDEIMASGHARAEAERTGKRVKIVDAYGFARWDDLWRGLPWIAQPHELGDFAAVRNAPGCRPYLQYPWTRTTGQRFTSWRAADHIGALHLFDPELAVARARAAELGPFVVVEPSIAAKSNPNKQWGQHNWRRLARMLIADGVRVVQMSAGQHIGDGVAYVRTRSFREAAALLTMAQLAVLPEGGLHHAAGVLGVRAVVLFGGTIAPDTTGYPHHLNVADRGEGSPCGKWGPCRHCDAIWRDLAPGAVAEIVRSELNARRAA